MIRAGATPKDTASTSESSSAPNAEPVRVNRATRPSSMSRMPAHTMHQAAKANSPRAAATIANTPKNRFPRGERGGQDDDSTLELYLGEQPPSLLQWTVWAAKRSHA